MKRITVTAFASCIIQDVDDLEAYAPNHSHSMAFSAGDVKTFNVSERAYDTRIRPQLVTLSQMRIQANDGLLPASRTRPSITYTVEDIPGQRARITQVNSPTLSVGAPAALILTGINLIPGLKGAAAIGTGLGLLTATAVRKGPSNIRIVINPGAAATAVVTTISDTGAVVITVTPTVAQSAVLIAAQINGDVLASRFVLAGSGGAGKVTPTTMILTGGDDAGVAVRYFPTVLPLTSFLIFEAQRPGNPGNTIAIRILAPGAASVVVVGNLITVTPAAGFIDVVSIAAQLAASAPATALGVATAVGVSDLSPSVFGYEYLYGGAGEGAVASIGGAAAAITAHTDTSVTLTVLAAALLAAGVLASEHAVINILTGYQRLQAQIPTVA